MVIKLKNNLKNYFFNIWLIEIVIVVGALIYFGLGIYNQVGKDEKFIVFSSIQRTIFSEQYYKEQLEKDVYEINENYINYAYYNFEYLEEDDDIEFIDLIDDNIEFIDLIDENIYFVIKNNVTNKIITNDYSVYDELVYNTGAVLGFENENFIDEYILSNKNTIYVCYDEEENIYTKSKKLKENLFFPGTKIEDCTEYYYTTKANYMNESEIKSSVIVTAITIIILLLLIKIVLILIYNRGKIKVRGNFIINITYIFKHGFKYSQTRRSLVTTIIIIIIFFIVYLYLLAIGRYEDNIIAGFFSRYPFKGSFILISLPIIFIFFSIKKSIDICLVNERLREINKGNLDYELVEQGSPEIRELIKDIIKIKDGYKIALQEVLSNEKMKTELISNVSHDLRTPLTSIINYVNILGTNNLTDEEKKDCIKILDEKSKKLKILIDDLFEMSKINSGKINVSRERIEVMSLIYQVIGEYSYLYEEKNVDFVVESSHEEIYMELDGKMMSRVFENIVINSLKYSLENTRIYIQVKDFNDKVEIAFKNIANYKMEFNNNDIFERFVRGDKSRNSKVEGSGLGLAITKSMIELHEGEVQVAREGDMFKLYVILPKQ